jgi:asparagine synthase (glutamine-hydrolysing)
MRELLSAERVRRRGLFSPTAIERMVQAHVDGRENHAHVIFPLMVFERWAESFVDGALVAPGHPGGR